MQTTWKASVCPVFGAAFDLQGLKEGESGNARKSGDRFVAHAFVNGHYYNFKACTVEKAMKRLDNVLKAV